MSPVHTEDQGKGNTSNEHCGVWLFSMHQIHHCWLNVGVQRAEYEADHTFPCGLLSITGTLTAGFWHTNIFSFCAFVLLLAVL